MPKDGQVYEHYGEDSGNLDLNEISSYIYPKDELTPGQMQLGMDKNKS